MTHNAESNKNTRREANSTWIQKLEQKKQTSKLKQQKIKANQLKQIKMYESPSIDETKMCIIKPNS